jgi:hypothetical protein
MEVTTNVTTSTPAVEELPASVSEYLGRALGNLYCAAGDLVEAWCELNEPDSFVAEVLRDVERATEALREMGVEAN